MREIKFRQPILVNGEFHSWHYWGFIDDSFIGAIHDKGKTIAGDSYQFTGLKDKNGKPIFEGDILKATCPCGHVENLPVKGKDGYNGFYLEAKYQHNWPDDLLRLDWPERYCEVIGDIWQNPELMEAK
jgi:hypothetical protein